jgi:hypothetical protein
MHLTNYSVNKKSRSFVQPGEDGSDDDDSSSSTGGSSSKWSLHALKAHIQEHNPGQWERVWQQVLSIQPAHAVLDTFSSTHLVCLWHCVE